jgi:hypothetical protein
VSESGSKVVGLLLRLPQVVGEGVAVAPLRVEALATAVAEALPVSLIVTLPRGER